MNTVWSHIGATHRMAVLRLNCHVWASFVVQTMFPEHFCCQGAIFAVFSISKGSYWRAQEEHLHSLDRQSKCFTSRWLSRSWLGGRLRGIHVDHLFSKPASVNRLRAVFFEKLRRVFVQFDWKPFNFALHKDVAYTYKRMSYLVQKLTCTSVST